MKARGDAWSGFWKDEPAAASGATLANLPPDVRARMDAPWSALARLLPPKAKVLDLATGGGIVLELLRQRRRDLTLVGIDAAASLPRLAGLKLLAKTRADALPFGDASFDAVTSRFGIEYGDLGGGGAEAARVLRHGGRLCMILHHAESEVLRHNRARRGALQWAAHESGWPVKAANLARLQLVAAMPMPPAFRAAPAEAAARFPAQSVAWEFLTGLVQVLEAGLGGDNEAGVRQLVDRADDELARLAALEAAACDQGRIEELCDALERGGVSVTPPRPIVVPDGGLLAWVVEGLRE